jgi:hypothetical protein
LNGQTVLFVARRSGLAEEANGWQAFFSIFETFFTGLEPRITRISSPARISVRLRIDVVENGNAAEQNALRR